MIFKKSKKLEKAIDLSFIYELVENLYSPYGVESIDPVVLIKLNIIQYTFGIRSMRQTIKEIEVKLLTFIEEVYPILFSAFTLFYICNKKLFSKIKRALGFISRLKPACLQSELFNFN